jgi:phage virion morphogenesis protein
MTGAGIRIDGEDAALGELGRLTERAGHARGMYEIMGASLVVSTQRHFEEGRAPDGSPWPPSIRALVQGGKTLIDRGRLFGSMTFNAWDTGVEEGTNVVYAGVHQGGATITAKTAEGLRFKIGEQWVTKKSVTIPARPFLGLDDDDERELIAIAEDWLRPRATAPSGPEARP